MARRGVAWRGVAGRGGVRRGQWGGSAPGTLAIQLSGANERTMAITVETMITANNTRSYVWLFAGDEVKGSMGWFHDIDGPPNYLTAALNGGRAGDDGWPSRAEPSRAEPSRAEPSERSLIVLHWLYIRCALFLDACSRAGRRAASERGQRAGASARGHGQRWVSVFCWCFHTSAKDVSPPSSQLGNVLERS